MDAAAPPPDDVSPPSQYEASLSQLRSFSSALSTFLLRHDDLQRHLVSIQSSLDSIPPPRHPPPIQNDAVPSNSAATTEDKNAVVSVDSDTTADGQNAAVLVDPFKHKTEGEKALASPTEDKNAAVPFDSSPTSDNQNAAVLVEQALSPPPRTEDLLENAAVSAKGVGIGNLCATSSIKGLRRYISTNLSRIEKLRLEVPIAMKLCPNPSSLVLRCFGRFFLQGIRAFEGNTQMVPARQVSILLLEFYLLMGPENVEVEEEVKKEANSGAVAWRTRLIREGGLRGACEIEGRGLLLFVGCFGIPKVFRDSDLRDLIVAGKASEVSGALRKSRILINRVPRVIEKMKIEKDYKAISVIYTFGMESKFPPQPILSSFIQDSVRTWEKAKKSAHGSLTAQMDAYKRHLVDLKTILGCLREHNINHLKILPDFHITEKIDTLEKEISDLKQKIGDEVTRKRRLDIETNPSKRSERREEKRSRFSDHSRPHQHRDHDDYSNGRISSECLTPPVRVLDIAFPGQLYPPYEAHHRLLPEHRGEPYGLHRDTVWRERLIGRSFAEPSTIGVNDIPRHTTLVEEYRGLRNPLDLSGSNRGSASTSDLYQFADAVAEMELFGGSRGVPSVLPSQYSSYLH